MLPPFSQPTLKLIDLQTNSDGSKCYDENPYFPPGGLLYIWDDILMLAQTWVDEKRLNRYSLKLHRNEDGFPTAVVRTEDEIILLLGAVKSNSNGYRLQKIEGAF